LNQRDICTPILVAALFTKSKTWNQPKCPATDEWVRKMWNMQTIKYYKVLKKWNPVICSNIDGAGGHDINEIN
jgi:hypothetical protein